MAGEMHGAHAPDIKTYVACMPSLPSTGPNRCEPAASVRGRAAGAKRKLGVRERLQRKLLSGQARRLVADDLQTADADAYRDSMQNRWAEL